MYVFHFIVYFFFSVKNFLNKKTVLLPDIREKKSRNFLSLIFGFIDYLVAAAVILSLSFFKNSIAFVHLAIGSMGLSDDFIIGINFRNSSFYWHRNYSIDFIKYSRLFYLLQKIP